ncbi:hypothetical protein BLOT_006585, partial [Blomia tropicalis]
MVGKWRRSKRVELIGYIVDDHDHGEVLIAIERDDLMRKIQIQVGLNWRKKEVEVQVYVYGDKN